MDSISKNSRSRNKKQLSFREFEGSTNDVWEDIDDDIIKLSSSPSHDTSSLPQVWIIVTHYISHIFYFVDFAKL